MESNIQKEFGLKLKNLRLSKGFSQEKFALLIDMDRTYYASVESGKRNVSLINLKKIANGFELTMSDFFKEINL